MDDLISRDFIKSLGGECIAARDSKTHELLPISSIDALPSAQSEVDLRKIGEWDMFNLISSAWYGKECYFKQDDEMVYSRISGKYMKVDDALREFLGEINDG